MAFWYTINLAVSAFGNILAYGIIKLNGSHGIAGWRWIFMLVEKSLTKTLFLTKHSIEGALTIGAAIIGYFTVIGFPDQILGSGKYGGFTQRELEIA